MTKLVVLTTPGFVTAIQGKDIPDADLPPPGLLLSLGDGSAVEVTAEMVERAANAIAIRRGWGPFTLPLGDYVEGSKIGQCVADARAALTALGLQIEGDGLAEGEAK